MKMRTPTVKILLTCALLSCFSAGYAQDKPNIVLVFMDNFGWGEPGFNGGGIIRGAATPRLDSLAAEGLRLTNFNVESQCTP
jgi:arylsulfatase